MITFGSLFSGIGGFDLAFENAGMQCLWQCEKDKAASAVLARHWPTVERFDDVCQITGGNARAVDVICGGFPCQDLSVAGRRKGLAGERSGLWFEFLRILTEIRPGWVVIENVPGLLSSNGGRDFAIVLRGLAECGYLSAWRILDAQYFGVAQRRRRVFVVASLGNGRAAEVLFEREGVRWNPPTRKEAGQVVAALSSSGAGTSRPSGTPNEYEYLTTGTFKVRSGKPGGGKGYLGAEEQAMTISSSPDQYVAHALTSRHDSSEDGTGRGVPLVAASVAHSLGCHTAKGGDPTMDTYVAEVWHENKSGNLAMADTARRLRAGASHSYQGVGVRRLTPTECERLQGFTDGWTDGQSDSARYKQLGNAVAVPVVEWLGRRLMEVAQ